MKWLMILLLLVGCGDIASSNSTSNNQQEQAQEVADSGCGQYCCGECLEGDDDVLTPFERACAFCCSENNELSEASCVDETEGLNNINGDCAEELLLEAGCSQDLSQ